MIRAALGNHETVFKEFVKNWIRLLSVNDFKEALKQIDAPNNYGLKWSVESLQKVLEDYVGKGFTFSITDPNKMEGDGRPNLIMLNGLQSFGFEFDLPINGKWSDLTIQFEFINKTKGYYAVVLHDIHVL